MAHGASQCGGRWRQEHTIVFVSITRDAHTACVETWRWRARFWKKTGLTGKSVQPEKIATSR